MLGQFQNSNQHRQIQCQLCASRINQTFRFYLPEDLNQFTFQQQIYNEQEIQSLNYHSNYSSPTSAISYQPALNHLKDHLINKFMIICDTCYKNRILRLSFVKAEIQKEEQRIKTQLKYQIISEQNLDQNIDKIQALTLKISRTFQNSQQLINSVTSNFITESYKLIDGTMQEEFAKFTKEILKQVDYAKGETKEIQKIHEEYLDKNKELFERGTLDVNINQKYHSDCISKINYTGKKLLLNECIKLENQLKQPNIL